MEFNLNLFKKNKKEQISVNKEVVIDGIVYDISLSEKATKSGSFELSFDADGTHFLVNKGILQFYKLVDEIKIAIEELQQKTNIKEITFRSSSESTVFKSVEKFQKGLQERFKENPNFLDGFTSGGSEGNISIKNGLVELNTRIYFSPIKRIFKKEPVYFKKTENLSEVIDNFNYLEEFFLGYIPCENLCQYGNLSLEPDIVEDLFSEYSDKSDQRNKLYQRVLERKFPDLIIQFKNDEFKLILDKQKSK
jgi:hypothetical protein